MSLRHRFGSTAALVVLLLSVIGLFGFSFEQWRRVEATRPQQAESLALSNSMGGGQSTDVADAVGPNQVVIFVDEDDVTRQVGVADPDVAERAMSELLGQVPEPGDPIIDFELGTADGTWSFAAAPCETADDCVRVLAGEQSISYPAYLQSNWLWLFWPPLVLALIAYLITQGLVVRSLQPIETMRRELESITSSNPGRRVTITETGDEVEHLGATLNETLDRLESAVLANERLVADAAHELRTPLTAVRAALEVENTREPRVLLEESLEEVDRAGQLIDDLLLLARSPSTDSRLELVDLDDVVVHEVRRLQLQHPDTEIRHDVNPVQQRLARDAIGSVVRNLLENAAKYGDGLIKVSLAVDGQRSLLIVDDNGPGIPADQRDDVLRRFARLDRSRDRSTGGSGLGLAIVTETVEAHRGDIEITDSPLGGCRFVVALPLESAAVPLAVRSARPGGAMERLATVSPTNDRRWLAVGLGVVGVSAIAAAFYLLALDGTFDVAAAGDLEGGGADVPSVENAESLGEGGDQPDPAAPLTDDGGGSVDVDDDSPPVGPPIDRSPWTVQASASPSNGTSAPEQAIDGDLETRWTTGVAQDDRMWFEIDLGSDQSISRIELLLSDAHAQDFPRSYEVRLSSDTAEPGPIVAGGDGTASDTVIEFPTQQARYIRIVQTGTSPDQWWSISEIDIYR